MTRLRNNGLMALGALVLGVLLLAGGEARAQAGGNPQTAVLQLNQQAMLMYGNLQFAEAIGLLKQAEATCRQYGISGPVLARTYLNMGVVEVGGNQNNAAGLEYFKRAVCADQAVMLDPLNSTPEVETLFSLARSQAKTPGACQQAQPQPQPVYPQPQPQPQPQPVYPQPQPQPQPQMQLIRHTPVTQQVRMVPVPIYLDVNPAVSVGQVLLFYRTTGERIFQQVPMQQHLTGWAATIGCDVLQTFDPTGIEYYAAVLDPANRLLGTEAAEAQPHQVTIVGMLTVPPPTLPNEAPPTACQEECPPWNPDCNSACKKFGDLCDSDSECCAGMACVHEMCTETDGEGGGPAGDIDPIVRIPVSFGINFGLVAGGNAEPYNQVSEGNLSIGTGFTFGKLQFAINPMFYLPVDGLELGLKFRGGLPLEMNYPDDVPPVAPSIYLSASYRIAGDGFDGFQLHA
ncbi:MAG TPA: hypothetical protein VM285_02835, partial [Polyangia bacterium]|nr:hypothetical protein [Polyangia bacterium]